MTPNPLIGVVFHWLGGLASGSFYVPFRAVRKWSWETYWLVGGVFSWIIVPWVLGSTISTDLLGVLHQTQWDTIGWVYFFGVLWGFGGLTFGLTMRYLGMSLGMAMVLGYCAAFGTLIPPIYHGQFFSHVLPTHSGQVIVLGIAICMAGIAFAGKAGMSKEKEMSAEQKTAVIREFNLKKGVIVATFSGVMSACFSFGLDAGAPIKALALQHGTSTLWQGLPVLVVLLAGGFTTNFVWCLILNIKNHTGYQYFSSEIRNRHPERGEERMIENIPPREMYARLKGGEADILVSGSRTQFVALKAKVPWLDINQERHVAYAGYDGMVTLVRELHRALTNPVWEAVRRPAPWEAAAE